jgi:charged multivesicular body protein 2A
MKEYQRTLNRSIRELERERGRLEQQEKKIILDIKKAAKENQLVRY